MGNKRSLYSVALNGTGYILRGAPNNPQRTKGEASLRGLEPSEEIVDLDYKDSSSFLPWAQTDWSGGFQFEMWQDNAGFLRGDSLEYIEKFGQISLLNDQSDELKNFGTGFTFGASKEFNNELLIGINKTNAAELWSVNTSDTFAEETTGWSTISNVNDIEELHGKAWLGLTTTGADSPLQTFDGSSFADITLTGDLSSSTAIRMTVRIEDRIYVAGYTGTEADGDALMYSDDDGSSWTTLIAKTGRNRQITQGVDNFGSVYFLIEDGFRTELWWVNNTIVTQVYRWDNLTSPKIGAWNGNVYVQGLEDGKLRYFQWDGAALRLIFEETVDSLTVDTSDMVIWKESFHSFGLVYDGAFVFPGYNFQTSGNDQKPFRVWGSSSSQVPYFQGLNASSELVITKLDTDAFQTSGSVETGRFSANKVAVDKLWHSVTLQFEKLAANQTIQVEYSTDDTANYTSIGTITFASAGTNTEATLYFPENTLSKKINLRITLGSGGSDTPIVQAFIARYLIMGDNRFQWNMELLAYDGMTLLDGKTLEEKYADELKSLLHLAKWNNQIVNFEDVDYNETKLDGSLTSTATTITVDDTSGFPEQGRLKINQEEVFYTGKTATTFTGVTRGERGTEAIAHSDDDVVSNKYRVLVTRVEEVAPVSTEPDSDEAVVRIGLLEV